MVIVTGRGWLAQDENGTICYYLTCPKSGPYAWYTDDDKYFVVSTTTTRRVPDWGSSRHNLRYHTWQITDGILHT